MGVKTAEAVFEAVRRRRIPWCTFWASSYDNLLKRPRAERMVLNELFAAWFSRLAENPTVHREHVRVRVLGEWRELLADAAVQAMMRVREVTAEYQGPALTFLVGYDGDRELVAATNVLLQARTGTPAGPVALADLRAHAWTKELPDVDFLIRTGSWEDPHRSANFLPFLTSNVQESYPQLYWPDFSEEELQRVIDDFAARGRRLGA
ncbi:MAG: undecaprenyl pyrophosphate synthetase [Parcubacteria group bacterium Gr01-1014_38]|nr:MAG: undecaprenyl pyrophosphate synthetase [Parcubacteria group bacterium Gr01-1014_38]